MNSKDYLQLVLEWLYLKKQQADPEADPAQGIFFRNASTNEEVADFDSLAALFESGTDVTIGYADGEELSYTAQKSQYEKRLEDVGYYEKNIPGFVLTEEELKKVMFSPEYDVLHENALELDRMTELESRTYSRYPLPDAATNDSIFLRGYPLYLDTSGTPEAHRKNLLLQQSLSTDSGRKDFVRMFVKDIMEADLSDVFQPRSITEGLQYYRDNRKTLELLWIGNHFKDIADARESYEVGEPLKSAFEKKRAIAQDASDFRTYLQAARQKGSFLLPVMSQQKATMMMSSADVKIIEESPHFLTLMMTYDEIGKKAPKKQQLQNMGAFRNDVKITDAENNPVTLDTALNALMAGKTVKAVQMTEQEKADLQSQLDHPYETDENELAEAQRRTDEILRREAAEAVENHNRELAAMGPLGQIRKELEYQQFKLGTTDHVRDDEYRKQITARILALGSVALRLQQAEESLRNGEYEQADFDELAKAVTDPELIEANVEQIAASNTFKTFYGAVNPGDLDAFCIKENEYGGLTENNFDNVTDIARLFSERLQNDADFEYEQSEVARSAAYDKELENAKAWYANLGEQMKAKGLDLNNPYTMALLQLVVPPAFKMDDLEFEEMEPDEIFAAIHQAGDGFTFAALPHSINGGYMTPMPSAYAERKDWLKNNLPKYADVKDREILNMYRMSKENRLVISDNKPGAIIQNPPSLIKTNGDSGVVITDSISELLPAFNKADDYSRFEAYGYTHDEAVKIADTVSYNIGIPGMKGELIDRMRSNGGSDEMCREAQINKTWTTAIENFIVTGVNHPEWMAGPNGDETWKGFCIASIPEMNRTDEEKEFVESHILPSDALFETERMLLKRTGEKNIDTVIFENKVKRMNGNGFTRTDSLKFLEEVNREALENAVLIETTDKKTGRTTTLPYIKYLDMGMLKACSCDSFMKRLDETSLVSDNDNPAFEDFGKKVAETKERLVNAGRNGEKFVLFEPTQNHLKDAAEAAEKYRASLADSEMLTNAQIQNLKAAAHISLISEAARSGHPFAGDPAKAVALKIVFAQAERFIDSKGEITVPEFGGKPERQVQAKDFGMEILKNPQLQNSLVDDMMKRKSFKNLFADKRPADLLNELKKPDIFLLEEYTREAKASKNSVAEQNIQPGKIL